MDSTREKINNLIIQADNDIQNNDISLGLQKLEIAKQMATELEWDERVGTISSLIEDINKKKKIQEEHDKKLKEIDQKKLEKIEKDKQLDAARERLQDRKKEQKQQKLEALRKKKEIEEKLSSEAYDLLETGSKALLKNDYQKGIDSFTLALEKFKTIRWSAEVNRTQELLNDAQGKYKKYEEKLKDDESKAEKVWEAQIETQKTIELSRKLQEQKLKEQESISMEVKKEELLKKEKSDKALSLLDDAIQYRNLNQFDSAIKAYEVALELFKEIDWQKEAIEVKEEIGLTIKQREKLEFEKKKLEKDLMKKRLDEEEIEKKVKESYQLKEFKEQEERNKRKRELEILSQKEEKLKEILANISIIEDLVNNYEDLVHLGNILTSECPYPNAIEIYGEGSQKLREIGFNEQADRLADGESQYKEKNFKDEKLRVNEKNRLEKIKQEEDELEKKAKEAQILREEKLRIEKEKRQKELEALSKKESRLKDVLKDISIIEEVISGYEGRVGLGKILSLECPYPKAVELYFIGTTKLREIGLIEQADRLEEGGNTYKKKIENDNKLRKLEKQRLEKVRLDEEEIERKAQEAQRIREEKRNLENEKHQKELDKITQKETQLKDVLANISEMEEIIKLFENQGDFKDAKSPYPEAIELYSTSSKKLSAIGFHEHAKLLKDGEVSYKQKLVNFNRNQEEKIKYLERVQKQEEEIEKKAEEARRKKEEKEKERRAKRQHELEALSKKESRLKDVLGDISKIEDVVNEYTREVGLGRILSLECPYTKAVELYKIGNQKLREAGLIKEADRLDEGRKTYEHKILDDEKLRSREEQRIEKARSNEEEIEKKAEIAQRLKELKDKELREKRQQELESLSKKESRLKDVLNEISKIEDVVSEYAREVGLGNILSLDCPYPKAVELYKIGNQKLRDAALTEQANRLDEGRITYEKKILEDEKLRSREKQRIEKTRLEIEEFERKAAESHRIKELKDKNLRIKRQEELEILSQKESKLKNVLGDISKIEDVVNEYVKGVGLGKILSLDCPYPKAVELYKIGNQKLRDAGLTEQANRLDEGRITYEKKIIEDKKLRDLEKQRLTKIEIDKEKLEMQAHVAAKLKEIKEKEVSEIKKKEQMKLSEQRTILTETLSNIAKIEKQVKKYEDQVGLGKILSTKCPFSNAIEIYRENSEKLKQIGLLEQSKSLDDGYILYKEKLIMDERNRKFEEEIIRKDQESKSELEQQILSSHKQEEAFKLQKEEEKEAIHNKLQIDQDKANKAFSLMDEGNKYAANFKFDEAIEKFQDAMDIFDEIKWLAELDKVLLQISIFRKQQDQKELEKTEEEELKVKKQKEMEEIDKIAKLSWEKKSEEERKKSEIEQRIVVEKRKQWELEFQGKIEEDKKKREIEEQQRLEQLKREQEIGLKHQNVYNDCLNLLDQAKTMVTEQQFEPAINIYKNVVEKYTGINYLEGIRITNESILKVQKLWDDHSFEIKIAQKSIIEREEEEKRLERLIKESKQKDERKKLLAEQKKLKIQLEKEKETNVQNEIISILEIAGNLIIENQFDKALEYYDKSIKLFKKIDWDLKYKQVLSIMQDAKAKKKHFGKLQKQFEERQKKDQKAQKAFKDFLEKQETDRKSKGEKIKKLTDQQKIEQKRRITLEDASYEFIDQAENCVKGRKYYLSLYYFHYALNNFIEIEWAREVKALKKRFLQVYNLISSPLIDINEILSNPKLDLEYHYANSLSLILLAQKRKDFLVAQTELKTVNEMAKNLKWPKSLKLLEDFMEILEKEKEDYKKEIEMKKYAPTEGKALNLMKEASAKIKNNEFDEGIDIANKAKEIYIHMSIEREARKVEQQLLRWKLKQSRYMLNQQRDKTKAVGPEKKTFLSEDERKNLIIEERKRRRREARKKLLGD